MITKNKPECIDIRGQECIRSVDVLKAYGRGVFCQLCSWFDEKGLKFIRVGTFEYIPVLIWNLFLDEEYEGRRADFGYSQV